MSVIKIYIGNETSKRAKIRTTVKLVDLYSCVEVYFNDQLIKTGTFMYNSYVRAVTNPQ